jgi:hypothetical protein
MTKKLIVSRFLDAKAKGDISGDWVAEPKYKFNVAPNEKVKTETLLQVWAKLNMDFSKGGDIEYICELIYQFQDFDLKKDYDQLINTAHNCNKDLEQLFDREKVVDRATPDMVIWVQWDYETVKQLVDENMKTLNR